MVHSSTAVEYIYTIAIALSPVPCLLSVICMQTGVQIFGVHVGRSWELGCNTAKDILNANIIPLLVFSFSLPPFPSHSLPPSLFPSLLPSPNSLSLTHSSASTTHLWLFCIAVLNEAFSVIPSERQLLSKVGKLPRSPLCQLGIRPHFMVWITLSPASFSSWEVPCVAFFRWEWDPERRTGLWLDGWVSVWVCRQTVWVTGMVGGLGGYMVHYPWVGEWR